MLAAAELYLRRAGRKAIFCAKLHHQNEKRCIFCEYQAPGAWNLPPGNQSVPLAL